MVRLLKSNAGGVSGTLDVQLELILLPHYATQTARTENCYHTMREIWDITSIGSTVTSRYALCSQKPAEQHQQSGGSI